MADRPPMLVLEDPRYREHRGPDGHPERPERLGAVGDVLATHAELPRLEPRPAEPPELLRVHRPEHLARLHEAARQAPVRLDADTFCGERSLEVALLAAGGTIELARAVARGEARAAIAAVRPPGHHAEADRAMGFCLVNNVAVAARALQAEEGVGRLLILDWDVHHGNGTQHGFEDDPSVLYFSTHQYPYYPGTGAASEAGRDGGAGATVNVPMPAGCGDAEYVGVMQRVLAPVVRDFAPELILISCGFDAHRDDPLASMEVSGAGFRAMARLVRELADEVCGGRLVYVLEGGYALSGLSEGTRALLDATLPEDAGPLPDAVEAPAGSLLRHVVEPVARIHAPRVPDLGAA